MIIDLIQNGYNIFSLSFRFQSLYIFQRSEKLSPCWLERISFLEVKKNIINIMKPKSIFK